jgi:hypothetical protein
MTVEYEWVDESEIESRLAEGWQFEEPAFACHHDHHGSVMMHRILQSLPEGKEGEGRE